MSLQTNWEEALKVLERDLSKTVYDAWFGPLQAVSIDEPSQTLYLEAGNDFICHTIQDRYMPLLRSAVNHAFDQSLDIVLSAENETPSPMDGEGEQEEDCYLKPRFTFDSFVVGSNNEYAYNAALAVAEAPAELYNPLFLYGDSGLGKTHLMHAIGHYIQQHFPNKKVLYVSSEMFTNELISALRDKEKKKIGSFKNKYRNIDVLLIDDIQFIEGKESVQEEFFHTFNTLYDRNKQIVISSDRHPKKLTTLSDRLISRFLWNVTADINPPDYEIRVAILMNKATEENIEIDKDVQDVISLIAEKIKYNVRELEGAFTRIISFSVLLNRPININLAREVLKDMTAQNEMKITISSIKKAVAKYFGISIKDMDSAKRNRDIAFPRQIAMFLSKEMTDNSLPKIGDFFGGRDHTTVLHAYKKISSEMEVDSSLKENIEELKTLINES